MRKIMKQIADENHKIGSAEGEERFFKMKFQDHNQENLWKNKGNIIVIIWKSRIDGGAELMINNDARKSYHKFEKGRVYARNTSKSNNRLEANQYRLSK